MREPTHEECDSHATVTLDADTEGIACWYPRMGGYHAHAVIVLDEDCVDVYVWHDGDFPFKGYERPPIVLHHCDGEQFVGFGHLLEAVLEGRDVAVITVYVAGAGDCYHASEECRDLNAGQKSGQAQGYDVRPLIKMSLSEAVAEGKKPCGTCGGTP
jgi:hypothetical protein